MGGMKESPIQKQILDWLAAHRILSFRMNTGAVHAGEEGKKRFFRFGVPGMADILAFPATTHWARDLNSGEVHCVGLIKPIWIECKATKGKQSELQKSFQEQVEAHGHRYIIARSIDDLEGLF